MPIKRKFSEIHGEAGLSQPKLLEAFFKQPAFVVLGDPDSGKTTSFLQAADDEPNAVFVTVRDFLTLSTNRWKGKKIYLDGLDE
jgi:hypothetical protein